MGLQAAQLSIVVATILFGEYHVVTGNGRLLEPPQRSSLWRDPKFYNNRNVHRNYNDHTLDCGGLWKMSLNEGKCGVCGDPWDLPEPRPNEAGGVYGRGIIARTYSTDKRFIDTAVQVTSSMGGYFEFNICPNNDIKKTVEPDCLENHPMRIHSKDRATSYGRRYSLDIIPGKAGIVELSLEIPDGLECTQCVLRWRWHGANNFGICTNGQWGKGCGDQPEIYNCADISIIDEEGNQDGDIKTKATVQTMAPINTTTDAVPVIKTHSVTIAPLIKESTTSTPISTSTFSANAFTNDAEIVSKLSVASITTEQSATSRTTTEVSANTKVLLTALLSANTTLPSATSSSAAETVKTTMQPTPFSEMTSPPNVTTKFVAMTERSTISTPFSISSETISDAVTSFKSASFSESSKMISQPSNTSAETQAIVTKLVVSSETTLGTVTPNATTLDELIESLAITETNSADFSRTTAMPTTTFQPTAMVFTEDTNQSTVQTLSTPTRTQSSISSNELIASMSTDTLSTTLPVSTEAPKITARPTSASTWTDEKTIEPQTETSNATSEAPLTIRFMSTSSSTKTNQLSAVSTSNDAPTKTLSINATQVPANTFASFESLTSTTQSIILPTSTDEESATTQTKKTFSSVTEGTTILSEIGLNDVAETEKQEEPTVSQFVKSQTSTPATTDKVTNVLPQTSDKLTPIVKPQIESTSDITADIGLKSQSTTAQTQKTPSSFTAAPTILSEADTTTNNTEVAETEKQEEPAVSQFVNIQTSTPTDSRTTIDKVTDSVPQISKNLASFLKPQNGSLSEITAEIGLQSQSTAAQTQKTVSSFTAAPTILSEADAATNNAEVAETEKQEEPTVSQFVNIQTSTPTDSRTTIKKVTDTVPQISVNLTSIVKPQSVPASEITADLWLQSQTSLTAEAITTLTTEATTIRLPRSSFQLPPVDVTADLWSQSQWATAQTQKTASPFTAAPTILSEADAATNNAEVAETEKQEEPTVSQFVNIQTSTPTDSRTTTDKVTDTVPQISVNLTSIVKPQSVPTSEITAEIGLQSQTTLTAEAITTLKVEATTIRLPRSEILELLPQSEMFLTNDTFVDLFVSSSDNFTGDTSTNISTVNSDIPSFTELNIRREPENNSDVRITSTRIGSAGQDIALNSLGNGTDITVSNMGNKESISPLVNGSQISRGVTTLETTRILNPSFFNDSRIEVESGAATNASDPVLQDVLAALESLMLESHNTPASSFQDNATAITLEEELLKTKHKDGTLQNNGNDKLVSHSLTTSTLATSEQNTRASNKSRINGGINASTTFPFREVLDVDLNIVNGDANIEKQKKSKVW